MTAPKLLHGDCLEKMAGIESGSVDMVLTDPPYGMDFQSQWKDKSQWMPKIANDLKPFVEFLPEATRCLKDTGCMIIFCRFDSWQAFSDGCENAGLTVGAQIIWDKVQHGMGDLLGAPALRHELALFASKGKYRFPGKRQQSIVVEQRVPASQQVHPNEKPLGLMSQLLKGYTSSGDTVLDCFTGVSPVGVACANMKRDFIGIELDPDYFAIAKRRIEEANNTLF